MSRIEHLTRSEAETWVIDCTFTDGDGDPLVLTGATIAWTVARRPGAAAVVTATTANGMITVVSATGGTAQISVPYNSHSSVTPGNWQHECRVTLSSGEITVQFYGRLTVRDSLFIV